MRQGLVTGSILALLASAASVAPARSRQEPVAVVERHSDGQGFAVFGRVIDGMDVVRSIQQAPTGQRGAYGTETLDPPVRVLKAYRKPRS